MKASPKTNNRVRDSDESVCDNIRLAEFCCVLMEWFPESAIYIKQRYGGLLPALSDALGLAEIYSRCFVRQYSTRELLGILPRFFSGTEIYSGTDALVA